MHFQKYPGDHAQWFSKVRGIASKVVLLGNPTGFEAEIEDLRQAGIEVVDQTDGASAAIASDVIARAMRTS
jgi:D-serine dehydratase